METKRGRADTVNGMFRHELSSQSSSTSLLEVPHMHTRHHYRSTSSSPSITPPTSPSLGTPSSPRSPVDYAPGSGPSLPPPGGYTHHHHHYQPSHGRHYTVERVYIKDPEDSDYFDESEGGSPYSSECSSINDVSDQSRVEANAPQGLRPGPQIILAKSLPDLLRISPTETDNIDRSCSKFLERPVETRLGNKGGMVMTGGGGALRPVVNRRVSVDNHGYHHGNIKRKESLQRTLSTADSKASTLVASMPVSVGFK